MNDYFKDYSILLADTYHKNLQEVSLNLIDLEACISAEQFSLGKCNLDTNYFLSASSKLNEIYKNE